ncbi:MAG: DUF4266 domain-containing protein [Rubrivivax sp.]|nr:DUF4266 domain-containing protein [Rubrivivax sp.]
MSGIGNTVRRAACLGLAGALALLAGCANPAGPAAWDKSFIAKPEMSMGWGRQAVKFDQHVYESKEGASGGYGVGGGGCGCN